MHRLIAAFGLLSFANLMVLQGSGACPLSGVAPHESASVSVQTGHAGHAMAAATDEEGLQQPPAPDQSHLPACLTMGPCALTLDVGGAVVVATAEGHAPPVVAGSDRLPPSLTTSPELPPPRA
jgi:hypothetical protein